MRKLLIASCVLSVALAGVSFASTTYTEQFIQKHTQGIVNKEKELTAKRDAQKAAAEAKKQEREKQKAAQKAKIKAKKDALNTLIGK